jgi:S-DNA-T family DNA segregation ATPase FtsK/SpoIIIE
MPPTFQRGPRELSVPLVGDVEIPAPPQLPTSPEPFSWINLLLPAGFSTVGMGLIYAATAANGNFHPLYLLATVPMMLASTGVSAFNSLVKGRDYRRQVDNRVQSYRDVLPKVNQKIEEAVTEERRALLARDPGPAECFDVVRRRSESLWDRSPGDPDFLRIRVGLGRQPNRVAVRLAGATARSDFEADPLLAEARELVARHAEVPDVPICLPLGEALVAGIQGPGERAGAVARAAILHFATHHAPDEVKLVCLFSAADRERWEWVRWLPHCWSSDRNQRYLATTKDQASRLLESLEPIFQRRAREAENRGGSDTDARLPIFVFLVADPSLLEGQPLVQQLLSRNPAFGLRSIFVGESLPNRCQVVVDVRSEPALLVTKTPTAASVACQPDQVTPAEAERFSRTLAPIRLSRFAPTESDLVTVAPLLGLLGAGAVDDLDPIARWQANDPAVSLAVPIGRQAGAARLVLDVHEAKDGPHGLVAGQTRWGKTAFLRTFIAALALAYHPHEVAFVLIDYKGGSLYRDLDALPHVVGVIDNLQEHLARRALLALKGELRRRQELFKRNGVGAFADYQRGQRAGTIAEPLPHLFVICDEFKELMANQPDFANEFISTACIGGGLGVHLVLATQQPDGVVSDQIWSNTRFRVCFHFDNPDSSSAVLRRRDASTITVRGRGYLQVGDDETFELFQSGYGDLPYAPGGADERPELFRVDLDGKRVAFGRPVVRTRNGSANERQTQIQAVVERVSTTVRENGIGPLRKFWYPPLPEEVSLVERHASRRAGGWDGQTWQPAEAWLAPVLGILDDPGRQWQGDFSLDLARNGNLGVYGGPQSGKTTFLQSLLLGLALAHPPSEVVFYVYDFGGQALTALAGLPHVGGVVTADETERFNWSLRYLLGELERRKRLFGAASVGNLLAYRQATGDPLPAIVLGVDNYLGFATAYPDAEDSLARLAQEGTGFGIYVVVTATTPRIRQRLKDNLPQSVSFTLVDRADYADAVGRTFGLEPADAPGRGLVKGTPPLEFQAARVGGADDVQRASALRDLVADLVRGWTGSRPRGVPRVPEVLRLADLIGVEEARIDRLPAGARAAPLGLDLQSLEPLVVDLRDGPYFLIAGTSGSGKSSLLQAWLLGLDQRYPGDLIRAYVMDLRGSQRPVARLPAVQRVQGYVTSAERFGAVLTGLAEEIGARAQALVQWRTSRSSDDVADPRAFLASYPSLVLAIDDFDAFSGAVDDDAKYRLEELLNQGRDLGFHLLLAGASSDLVAVMHDGLVRAARRSPAGFILGTSDYEDVQLLNLRLPGSGYPPTLPPGEGFFARRGRAVRVKVVMP